MPSTGFKVCWLTVRSKVKIIGDDEDDPFCEEFGSDGSRDEDTLSGIIRHSIRQTVMSERQKTKVGVETFLRARLETTFQICGKNYPLVCHIIHNNENWFKCSQSIPPEWQIEENPYEIPGSLYRISINLNPVGWYCMQVNTCAMPHTDGELSLSHIACMKISTLLAQEYLHTACCAYSKTFCKMVCDRRVEWPPMAFWKVTTLNLPKVSSDQMVDTMDWMEWSGILDR